MRVPIPVAGIILVIAGVVWLYGAANARLRRTPNGQIKPVVGPIHRTYQTDFSALHSAIGRQIQQISGARVIASSGDSFDVDVRPSLARVDDGMGLFVRIELLATAPSRTRCTVFGEPKSGLSLESSSRSALHGFERDLRMGLKRDQQVVVTDVHETEMPPSPPVSAPSAPPPAQAPAACAPQPAPQATQQWWS